MSFGFQKLLVLMTIKLHKTAVTSASKISQPYILLGPLGHTIVPGKVGELVRVCRFVCACVCSGLRGYIYVTDFIRRVPKTWLLK